MALVSLWLPGDGLRGNRGGSGKGNVNRDLVARDSGGGLADLVEVILITANSLW